MSGLTSAKRAARVRHAMAAATRYLLAPKHNGSRFLIGPVWLWIMLGVVWLAWFAVRLTLWSVTEMCLAVVLLVVAIVGTVEAAAESHEHHKITAETLAKLGR